MKYPILRSGFLTFTMTGLKQPNQPTDAAAMAILGKEHLIPDNDNFYHQNIQTLYVQSIKEAKEGGLNALEYQENVLKAAFEAFGTQNLYAWIDLQSMSPDFAPIHQAFIIETLEYLLGKPRKIHISQWIRLIEATSNSSRNNLRNKSYFERLDQIRKSGNLDGKLSSILVRWMRCPNGIYDLITSLEVIFGNRRVLSS